MKSLMLAIFLSSSAAFASAFIEGKSSVLIYSVGGKVVAGLTILDDVANKQFPARALYDGLQVKEVPIIDEHGNMQYGSYKEAQGLYCSEERGSYACTVYVDAEGQLSGINSMAKIEGSFTNGTSSFITFSNGGKESMQVSVTGDSAQAIYEKLTADAIPMSDEHGGPVYGAYKNGKNISCDVTRGTYHCGFHMYANGEITL